MKTLKERIIEKIKEKIIQCDGEAYMPVLRGLPIYFWMSPTGNGLEVEQLNDYVLTWDEFAEIVVKANELGGKMYRGDALAQGGGKLGYDIPYECMEGFIAKELLHTADGTSVTRRSTYYAGILAWAGIVTIHKSQGNGSFITVNSEYRA